MFEGLAGIGNNIGPYAMLAMAQGLLTPRERGGGFGAGLAGLTQGVMQDLQMKQMQEVLAQKQGRQAAQAALFGGYDPTAKAADGTNITWTSPVTRFGVVDASLTNPVGQYGPAQVGTEGLAGIGGGKFMDEKIAESAAADQAKLFTAAFPEQVAAAKIEEMTNKDTTTVRMPDGSLYTALKKNLPAYIKLGGIEVDKPKAEGGRDPVRTQRIEALTPIFGDETKATKFVDGVLKVDQETDPVTGQNRLFMVDMSTQQKTPLNLSGAMGGSPSAGSDTPAAPQANDAAPEPEQDTPLLGLVSKLGGLEALKEGVGKVSMGAYDPGAETNVPRQRFRLFNNAVLEMYGGTKMSNEERELKTKLLPDPGILESPERAYDILKTWHAEAQNILKVEGGIANDVNATPEMRKDAKEKMAGAQKVLNILGDPSKIARPSPSPMPGLSTTATMPPGVSAATPSASDGKGQRIFYINGQWQAYRPDSGMWVPWSE